MPWMSWATNSCPEAMRAFSWPRRSRLSFSELSICSWPSCSFPCWACRALWPSSTLSSDAAVSSLSSNWPSCYKKTIKSKSKQDLSLIIYCVHEDKTPTLPSGLSLHLAGWWLWRWERWLCAPPCAGRAAGESHSTQSALCCSLCGTHSTCLNPCLLYTLLNSETSKWGKKKKKKLHEGRKIIIVISFSYQSLFIVLY